MCSENYYRIVNFVKFERPCFFCKNNDNIYWVYTSDEDYQKINNRGDIKCNNINCYYNSHLLF